MEKGLQIVFIEIFPQQKPQNKNCIDPEPRFACVKVHQLALRLYDFPEFLKNIIFPTFLVNTMTQSFI